MSGREKMAVSRYTFFKRQAASDMHVAADESLPKSERFKALINSVDCLGIAREEKKFLPEWY